MNKQSLSAFKKLRDFEFEAEQTKLQHAQQDEHRIQSQFDNHMLHMHSSYTAPLFSVSPDALMAREKHFKEMNGQLELITRQLALARQATLKQMEKLFKAKRNCDMAERMIEHERERERTEFDMKERKQLDEIGQYRHFALKEVAAA